MSAEENKALARRLYGEGWNACEGEVVAGVFSRRVADHNTVPAHSTGDRNAQVDAPGVSRRVPGSRALRLI